MKISEIVAGMEPPRYTTSQAAGLVGRSVDTLRRWRISGVFKPNEQAKFGSLQVDLYTDQDIVTMRKIAMSIHPGPNKARIKKRPVSVSK